MSATGHISWHLGNEMKDGWGWIDTWIWLKRPGTAAMSQVSMLKYQGTTSGCHWRSDTLLEGCILEKQKNARLISASGRPRCRWVWYSGHQWVSMIFTAMSTHLVNHVASILWSLLVQQVSAFSFLLQPPDFKNQAAKKNWKGLVYLCITILETSL